MKNRIQIISFGILFVIFAACTPEGKKTEATDAAAVRQTSWDKTYTVDTQNSSLAWEGYKPTGTHHGTVGLAGGVLQMQDGELVGGNFVIDMQSIRVADLQDPDRNAKLTGHLKSADFFDVEKFPTARFEITEVRPVTEADTSAVTGSGSLIPTHVIAGNLIMKGISKNIAFNARIDADENRLTAATDQFFIDRVDWNVQYRSKTLFDNLKDNFINDEIGVVVSLQADAAKDLSISDE